MPKESGLGRALQRNVKQRYQSETFSECSAPAQPQLHSITQQQSLDEFLQTAELADADFRTARTQLKILSESNEEIDGITTAKINQLLPSSTELKETEKIHMAKKHLLRIPRRPNWNTQMTPKDLDKLERNNFIEWRRQLAQLTDAPDLVLTPFERNIEVWRQLWRVVERSDLLIQVVDARNPLFYRCEDFESYVKEVDQNKRCLLLLNKADLLSQKQRNCFADYLDSKGIAFSYFSAIAETEIKSSEDEAPILSVSQLINYIMEMAKEVSRNTTNSVVIGFVGYPNVGKSSTLNSLIKSKKTSVSSTPGKTKHFQTIKLSPECTLCDCPGLVFPNFATTKADLLTNGVLPIHEMRDYRSPIELICQRIPKECLELFYSINLGSDPVVTAEILLSSYAASRGFFTSNFGNPDESRAARKILQDYVHGELLYCHPPPNVDHVEYNSSGLLLETIQQRSSQKKNVRDFLNKETEESRANELDKGFFIQSSVNARSMGKKGIGKNKKEIFSGRNTMYPHQKYLNNDGTVRQHK